MTQEAKSQRLWFSSAQSWANLLKLENKRKGILSQVFFFFAVYKITSQNLGLQTKNVKHSSFFVFKIRH